MFAVHTKAKMLLLQFTVSVFVVHYKRVIFDKARNKYFFISDVFHKNNMPLFEILEIFCACI